MPVEFVPLHILDRAFTAEQIILLEKMLKDSEFLALVNSTKTPKGPLPRRAQDVVDKIIAARASLKSPNS